MNRILLSLAIMLMVFGCKRSRYMDGLISDETRTSIKTIDPLVLKPSPEAPEPVLAEPNTPAPATQVISLEQCRSLALENNLTLKAQLIAPTLAAESFNQERAKFEAVLDTGMRYRRASDTDSSSRRNYFNVDVEQPLATGGVLSVGLPFSDGHSSNSGGLSDAAVSVSYVQSLLRGAGIQTSTPHDAKDR